MPPWTLSKLKNFQVQLFLFDDGLGLYWAVYFYKHVFSGHFRSFCGVCAMGIRVVSTVVA